MGIAPWMCECLRYSHISPSHFLHSILLLAFCLSLSLDMESAIKTVVTTFLSSARGKENLDSKSFQKLVSKQLGGLMEVSNYRFLLFSSTLLYTSNPSVYWNAAIFFPKSCHIDTNSTSLLLLCIPLCSGHKQLLCR